MRGGSIAVVGGSIAGCATALAVSRGGAEKITVFERVLKNFELIRKSRRDFEYDA